MMKVKVSYIIPVYNIKEDYLRKCVNSLLDDNSNELEVILIDDCSMNGCGVICDEFHKKDDRVTVYHLDINRGVSYARNYGVSKCTGKWIVFVDADDWMEENTYGKLTEVISDDADIIVFSAFRESVNVTTSFGAAERYETYSRGDQVKIEERITYLSDNLLKQSLISTPKSFETLKYCWGKAYQRDFLIENNVHFPDLSYCEDIVFMADALNKAAKVVIIPDRLYHYRVSESSTVNSYRRNALSEQREFLNCLSKIIDNDENETMYYAALLSMQICITRFFYNKKRKVGLWKRHKEAKEEFSSIVYSNVFRHVDLAAMKRNEKWKALLLKHELYLLYYIGTEVNKFKSIRYK